ncbi:regenerating islet-derived protein 4-like isoform X2 [Hyla sarda]|nr:regenerating islet-derived protein 4-like isoform X2 [Hyla sarda]XP_056374302.1 regenerating islet-derived protein 4-like isoform X2 [Hyla sarda]
MAITWGAIILLVGSLAVTQAAEGIKSRSSCPNGWFYYKANCYGYFRDGLSWYKAEVDCQNYGHRAHLASIMDSAEAGIVASHISQNYQSVWIGLYDPKQNGRWEWSDSSLYSYRAWQPYEPNNSQGQEYCGELVYYENFVKWNDNNCNKARPYLCKYKLWSRESKTKNAERSHE